MKELWIRLTAETPRFFRIISRIAMGGVALFGGLLSLNLGSFCGLPTWLHEICTHGGAVCTVIVFMCHLVTSDKPPQNPQQ